MKSRLTIILAVLFVSGCVRVDVGETLPTIGEELVELENARQLGAVTEEEFKKVRRAILTRLL